MPLTASKPITQVTTKPTRVAGQQSLPRAQRTKQRPNQGQNNHRPAAFVRAPLVRRHRSKAGNKSHGIYERGYAEGHA